VKTLFRGRRSLVKLLHASKHSTEMASAVPRRSLSDDGKMTSRWRRQVLDRNDGRTPLRVCVCVCARARVCVPTLGYRHNYGKPVDGSIFDQTRDLQSAYFGAFHKPLNWDELVWYVADKRLINRATLLRRWCKITLRSHDDKRASAMSIYTVFKKTASNFLFAITSSTVDQFWKCFHCWKQQ